jgi:hypothetical protein
VPKRKTQALQCSNEIISGRAAAESAAVAMTLGKIFPVERLR